MRESLADLLDADEHILCQARIHWLWNLRGFGLPNLFSTLLITDRRILQQTGILTLRTRSLALSQIESREVDQSLLGRILGFCDIRLHGSGGIEINLDHIAQPMVIARAIGKATVEAPPGNHANSPAPSAKPARAKPPSAKSEGPIWSR